MLSEDISSPLSSESYFPPRFGWQCPYCRKQLGLAAESRGPVWQADWPPHLWWSGRQEAVLRLVISFSERGLWPQRTTTVNHNNVKTPSTLCYKKVNCWVSANNSLRCCDVSRFWVQPTWLLNRVLVLSMRRENWMLCIPTFTGISLSLQWKKTKIKFTFNPPASTPKLSN